MHTELIPVRISDKCCSTMNSDMCSLTPTHTEVHLMVMKSLLHSFLATQSVSMNLWMKKNSIGSRGAEQNLGETHMSLFCHSLSHTHSITHSQRIHIVLFLKTAMQLLQQYLSRWYPLKDKEREDSWSSSSLKVIIMWNFSSVNWLQKNNMKFKLRQKKSLH